MKNAKRSIKLAMMAAPALSAAQTPLPLAPDSKPPVSTQETALGGIPSLDVVRLSYGGTGAPLRFGNVLKGTEWITLNGVKLKAGTDYSIDYAVGVVYVNVSYREGDALSVQYRHDPKAPIASGSVAAGLPALKYNLGSPSLALSFGAGSTERTADGKIYRSNILGTANKFGNSKMGLSGAYFGGTRTRETITGGMSYDSNAKGGNLSVGESKTSFLVQQFRVNLGGGSFTANVQDISKDFSGFNNVKESGYSDGEIGAFSRERGLKRDGMGFDSIKLGQLSFSGKNQNVTDEGKGISSSSYTMGGKNFKFSSNSESIERGFKRFQDTGAGDWQRLQQSQGIQNSNRAGEFNSAVGKLSFTNTKISDTEKDKSIVRSSYGFENQRLAFDFGSQEVDKSFNRFEADRGQFGLEAGLRRQNFNLTKALIGKGASLTMRQSSVKDKDDAFNAQDVKLNGKTWSLNSSSRSAAQNFSRLGSLQAPEMDSHIGAIASMYGNGVQGTANDRGAFLQSKGIERRMNGGETKIGKDGSLKVSNLNIKGQTQEANLNQVQLNNKNVNLSVKQMNLGAQFDELTRLMQFEQRQLGNVIGLKRTDIAFGMNMGKKGSFAADIMTAQHNGAGMDRAKLSYSGTGINIDFNQRNIGNDFGVAGQIEDQERGVLATLQGFKQTDSRIRYSALKNIQFEYAQSQAFRNFDQQSRSNEFMNFNWAIDRATQVAYQRQSTDNSLSSSSLFASTVETLMVQRKIGNSSVQVTNETQAYNGSQNQNADSKRVTVAVETPLTKSTSLRTEQTKTDFSNGGQEQIQSNTISTKVLKQLGVSVTDTNIDRDGVDRDEVKRDYGFWWDFGKGVRMSYGQARYLNGQNSGTNSTGFAFGQDVQRINPNQAVNGVQNANVNGTTLGYANGSNSWDDQQNRTQAFSSFALQTTKPFRFGFLEDSKFSMNSYQASDNSRWLREDINSSFESRIGKYGLGYRYKGQVDQQGARAIDRTFMFRTDSTGKSPLSATLSYKRRELPDSRNFDIRDYKLDWRFARGLLLSNQIQTNPEGPVNPNIVLGTLPIAQSRNIWRVDFNGNKNFTFGGQFDEMRDDTIRTIRRTTGANFSLWNASGSPLNFFYGIEQNSNPLGTNSFVRYGLTFDQRPGPNQIFSLSIGNQGWLQNQNAQLAGQNDWIARLNFQVRFK